MSWHPSLAARPPAFELRHTKRRPVMNKTLHICVAALCGAVAAAVGVAQAQQSSMTFFVTSVGPGKGGDLGGLEGADRHCQSLAQAAGAGGKTWHAYLSTQGSGGVNAKDRVGNGPWFNAKGVQIAAKVADLHSDNSKINKETALDEKGMTVKGRGDT